ncbi:hypothetical protein [Actinokineospora globicatena]|uniref:hypothetical protein n=1 Tax=Actinokineospora globicatena TaxID=103729 RepID=UPI0020A4EC9A|nr:hypothetical protein [Actinokineospora globicatena]MCP2304471.1 hypothetical protein [Actinokineospora globicatena]GLW78163.1 hypothetical protein Aglo01_26450 [Actinokineospora globicatena]GLW85171.1 hypothetical protein Aglo02_28110 [Actinokineospora globicatena]
MSERFTEDEFAFLRHVRFGELPARVRPEDLVTVKETEPAADYADLAYDVRHRAEG